MKAFRRDGIRKKGSPTKKKVDTDWGGWFSPSRWGGRGGVFFWGGGQVEQKGACNDRVGWVKKVGGVEWRGGGKNTAVKKKSKSKGGSKKKKPQSDPKKNLAEKKSNSCRLSNNGEGVRIGYTKKIQPAG